METKYTFEKLIKIRIGEPITAVALNRSEVPSFLFLILNFCFKN